MQRVPNQAPSSRIETSQPFVLELLTAEDIRLSKDFMLREGQYDGRDMVCDQPEDSGEDTLDGIRVSDRWQKVE